MKPALLAVVLSAGCGKLIELAVSSVIYAIVGPHERDPMQQPPYTEQVPQVGCWVTPDRKLCECAFDRPNRTANGDQLTSKCGGALCCATSGWPHAPGSLYDCWCFASDEKSCPPPRFSAYPELTKRVAACR